MKKIKRIISSKYRKFKISEISYIFKKTLVISVVWSKCKNEVEKIFKEEESIEILKIIGLIKKYNYFRNTVEENISQ